MGTFDETYRRSLEHPEEFWAEAAAEIDWVEPWERVLDASRAPFYRWFTGGRLNTCHNALDRHVERGRADQPALIYDSPVTGTVAAFSYRELREAVARFARALDRLQPMLLNMQTGGGTWVAHDVTLDQVRSKVELIEDGSESLGGYARAMVAQAVERGFLRAVAGPHAG